MACVLTHNDENVRKDFSKSEPQVIGTEEVLERGETFIKYHQIRQNTKQSIWLS